MRSEALKGPTPVVMCQGVMADPGPLTKSVSSSVCAERRKDSSITGHMTRAVSVWLETAGSFLKSRNTSKG